MRILVAIANYGSKNVEYAKRLIDEYRTMRFEVDIYVLSDTAKSYGRGVREIIGCPSRNPWSMPFNHKPLFARSVDEYDLFIYSEDDTLIREDNIHAFVRASEGLPEDLLPGFIRYEVHPDGRKSYPDIHGPFHWVPGSVGQCGEYIHADLSNDHSACFILTRRQLQRAIRSGGFSVPPHSGRYDLICAAATDPYTQCGFKRVICLSHLREFELHHLPNAYLNRTGLSEEGHCLQVGALLDVLQKSRSDRELFVTEKSMATPEWDRSYYEPCRSDLLERVPPDAARVLTVGCGSGATEAHLVATGKQVTAVPLDSVIGCLGERRGVRFLPPDFAKAFEILDGETFDAIVLPDVLQHLRDPVDILARLGRHLKPRGVLVGSVPNLGLVRRLSARMVAKGNKWSSVRGDFDATGLQLTSARRTHRWLKTSGLRPLDLRFGKRAPPARLCGLARRLPAHVTASDIVFVATRQAG